MIQSLIVTNPKGEELTLDLFRPELSGLYIKSIDGLGAPSASINTQDVSDETTCECGYRHRQ